MLLRLRQIVKSCRVLIPPLPLCWLIGYGSEYSTSPSRENENLQILSHGLIFTSMTACLEPRWKSKRGINHIQLVLPAMRFPFTRTHSLPIPRPLYSTVYLPSQVDTSKTLSNHPEFLSSNIIVTHPQIGIQFSTYSKRFLTGMN